MTEDHSASRRRRRRTTVVTLLAVVALLGLAGAFVVSAHSVYTELSAGRDDLLLARASLSQADLAAAQASFTSAAGHAGAAAADVEGPLWDLAAAIPLIGATPRTVRTVATSLDTALTSLAPAVATIVDLDPDRVIAANGTIDVAMLEAAVPPLESAREGTRAASDALAEAPSRATGDLVLTQVDEAATEFAGQLVDLQASLDAAIRTARIAPPLLGADGPKRYFVAILNPNESRGTGGFLGTYAILVAERGRISIREIGSNADLPDLPELPRALGEQYVYRYDQDPRLVANMNISPHHPAAAELWLASWRLKTSEELDGAISADVVALGALVTATGEQVPLPDGGSLTGEQLAEFAIEGIYEKFPESGDSPARKEYQEEVTGEAVDLITGSGERSALASALGEALVTGRIQLWSSNETTQQAILDASIGGSLSVPDGHHVAFAAINVSGSKLDAFLRSVVTYEVGRCRLPETRMVSSQVKIDLTSEVPEGAQIPDYMISLAQRGPDGPVNSTLAQVHLGREAQVQQVLVDGESVGYTPFQEQDRSSLVLTVDLPPRVTRTVAVQFLEPVDSGAGSIRAQPLALEQETVVTDQDCSDSP